MWVATLISIYITPAMKLPIKIDVLNINSIINFKILGVLLAIIGTAVVLKTKGNIA